MHEEEEEEREREKKKEQYFGKAEILYKVGTPNIKTELGTQYKIQILCKLYICWDTSRGKQQEQWLQTIQIQSLSELTGLG